VIPKVNFPILGFVAYSGTGKTTLLEKLIPLLRERGLHIGLLKHGHHEFDIDTPGKDSYRLREAGAEQVMVASRKRWALIHENSRELPEPDLGSLVRHFDESLDMLLVEGFKHEHYTKIELQRSELGKPSLFPDDTDIIAVVTNHPEERDAPLPVLDINHPQDIVDFIVTEILAR
jgi:molybdopterin-guanine dinucleotide biosynthesis protein MobB